MNAILAKNKYDVEYYRSALPPSLSVQRSAEVVRMEALATPYDYIPSLARTC
jgi:hypothetical protein